MICFYNRRDCSEWHYSQVGGIGTRVKSTLKKMLVLLCFTIGIINLSFANTSTTSEDDLGTSAFTPTLTIKNTGSCPVALYLWLTTGDIFQKNLAAGASWTGTTTVGVKWRAVNTNPDLHNLRFDKHYTVTSSNQQSWTVHPTYCNPVCDVVANAGADQYYCQFEGAQFLSASATGGTAPYRYDWSNGLGHGQHKTAGSTSTSTFTVTVTDANGCTATDKITLFIEKPSVQTTPDLYFCQFEGGQNFSANATGGKAPYRYDWSNGLGHGQHKTSGSTSTSTFTVTVTDANGCTATDKITIFVEKPSVQTTPDLTFCKFEGGQNFSANATGGKAPYRYDWSNGLGHGQHKTAGSTSTTTFTVTVTDANGCTATDKITIFITDKDGDGLCGTDDCAPDNPSLPAPVGSACNDGNPNTKNDKIQGDGCSCAGVVPTCPDGSALKTPGASCNDGNPNTQNDKIQGDGCSCVGVVPTCPDGSAVKTPGASCNDGNPNTQNDKIQGDGCSCVGVVPTCPDGSAVKTPGASCNDGNPNTQNDKIQGDGCSCVGVVPTCPDGSAVKTPGASCNDGNPNTQNDKIQGDGCSCVGVVPTCPDGSAVKTPGASCNDGNPNTQNDKIQGDGCSCVGVVPTCPDGSAVKTPGASCNDGNPNTQNDKIQGDGCSCVGVVPTCPDGSAVKTPGASCNDGNPNTQNDKIQGDGCSCVGVVPTCPDGSAVKTPGTSCNDGNPNTKNDKIQGDGCSCVGVVPTCPDGSAVKTPGASCNDGNPNTQNDKIQGDGCSCAGVVPTCPDGSAVKTPGASCNDGNPNTKNDKIQGDGCSCAGVLPTCPDGSAVKTPGAKCNDRNPNTKNDKIQADGCSCVGTPKTVTPTSDPCKATTLTIGAGNITIEGLDGAPVVFVKVLDRKWKPVFQCWDGDCTKPTQTVETGKGKFRVYVTYYSAAFKRICEFTEVVTVSSTPSTPPVDCICTAVFKPVCGSDGKTYSNSCEATCAGVTWTDGECGASPPSTSGCEVTTLCNVKITQPGTSILFDNIASGSTIIQVMDTNKGWATVFNCDSWGKGCGSSNRIDNLIVGHRYFVKVTTSGCTETAYITISGVDCGDSGHSGYRIGNLSNTTLSTKSRVGQKTAQEESTAIATQPLVNTNSDKQAKVAIYPNPAVQTLHINLAAYIGQQGQLNLINNMGQKVQVVSIDEIDATPIRLNLNQVDAGLYYLQVVIDGASNNIHKVIIGK